MGKVTLLCEKSHNSMHKFKKGRRIFEKSAYLF